jgi:two-component system, chemotaxis family, CheB/CheR fusion protein
VQHLSPERRERWFDRRDDTVSVKPELREAMIFAPQNLAQDPPFSRADLVVCRNVLIYLQPDLQRKLIRLFHFSLKEGGFLFLGNVESAGDTEELFGIVDKPGRLFRRIGTTRHDLVDFPLSRSVRSRDTASIARPPRRLPQRATERALQALADRYAPPAVLVGPGLEVLWYHGATDRFLNPQSGAPTHNLLALARSGLAPHLRRVVEAARSSGRLVTTRLRTSLPDGEVPLRIEAAPVQGDADQAIIVSFHEEAPARPIEAMDPDDGSTRERLLEDEIRTLREEVRETGQSALRSEEEFKAYNEEITSMNEELRAANEELETSKEELQAVNEELSTVNNQLRLKVDELRERTSDLDNLLRSTDLATIFLGSELEIRWFSPRATDLFRIRESDVKRPVSHVVQRFHEPGLEETCRRVLRDLTPDNAQVEGEDGRIYTRRITPYRADDRIAGIVITFTDVTEIHNARLYAESIVETVPTPLIVLDPDLRVVSTNPAFNATFQVSAEKSTGRLVYDLGNRQWDIPELRRLLHEVLPGNDHFDGYQVEHVFEKIGRKVMLLNGRRLDHVQLILLAVEDITERKASEEHQAMLMAELAHRVKNALTVVQIEHRVGQRQRNLGKGDQQPIADGHRRPERHDAGKDRLQPHVARDGGDDEAVDPHRRADQPHLQHDHHDHAEPDRIEAQPDTTGNTMGRVITISDSPSITIPRMA